LADIGECHSRRNRFDRLLCTRSVGVDYCRNFGSDDSVRKTRDMIGAHFAGTDNANSQVC
jgi:hypothetical protein